MGSKLTRPQRLTLEWFGHQPRPAFDFGSVGPSLQMRRWGLRAGFLATYVDGGRYFWAITDLGRAAIQEREG